MRFARGSAVAERLLLSSELIARWARSSRSLARQARSVIAGRHALLQLIFYWRAADSHGRTRGLRLEDAELRPCAVSEGGLTLAGQYVVVIPRASAFVKRLPLL